MCEKLSPQDDAVCDLGDYDHRFADVGEESGRHLDILPGATGLEQNEDLSTDGLTQA